MYDLQRDRETEEVAQEYKEFRMRAKDFSNINLQKLCFFNLMNIFK